MNQLHSSSKNYAYCIYLNDELYSRFPNSEKRAQHLKTMFFETASYQKEVRLLYFKDPPERVPPIPDDVRRLIYRAKIRNEAKLQDTAS